MNCPAPSQVTIELTTACNYRCKHCAVSTSGYRAATMPKELAFSIVDKIQELERLPRKLQLSGHGESTMLPWFSELIDYIRTKLPSIVVGFHTNGSKLEELAEKLVSLNKSVITVSVDGTGDIIDEIRGPGAFNKVALGLAAIYKLKRKRTIEFPIVNFVTILSRKTIFDLHRVVALASATGVNSILVQPLTPYRELGTHNWQLANLSTAERAQADEVIVFAKEKAKDCNVKLDFVNEDPYLEPRPSWHHRKQVTGTQKCNSVSIEESSTFRNCIDPWHNLFISVSGSINTCSHRYNDVEEDVSDHSLADIWYKSEGLKKVRTSLLNGDLEGACVACPYKPIQDSPPIIPDC